MVQIKREMKVGGKMVRLKKEMCDLCGIEIKDAERTTGTGLTIVGLPDSAVKQNIFHAFICKKCQIEYKIPELAQKIMEIRKQLGIEV